MGRLVLGREVKPEPVLVDLCDRAIVEELGNSLVDLLGERAALLERPGDKNLGFKLLVQDRDRRVGVFLKIGVERNDLVRRDVGSAGRDKFDRFGEARGCDNFGAGVRHDLPQFEVVVCAARRP